VYSRRSARAKIGQTVSTLLLLSPNTPVQVFRRPIEGDRHRKSITRANRLSSYRTQTSAVKVPPAPCPQKQPQAALFDHLVGAGEQSWWHSRPKRSPPQSREFLLKGRHFNSCDMLQYAVVAIACNPCGALPQKTTRRRPSWQSDRVMFGFDSIRSHDVNRSTTLQS
jgi:hypothetical protein